MAKLTSPVQAPGKVLHVKAAVISTYFEKRSPVPTSYVHAMISTICTCTYTKCQNPDHANTSYHTFWHLINKTINTLHLGSLFHVKLADMWISRAMAALPVHSLIRSQVAKGNGQCPHARFRMQRTSKKHCPAVKVVTDDTLFFRVKKEAAAS